MPKFGVQVDLQKIPLKGLVAERSGTAPASPVTGQLWDDSTNNLLKRWNGTAWETIATSTSSGYVPTSRTLTAGTGLTGGGDLTADRTFSVDFAASGATSATQAVRADDSRLSDARTPTAHSHLIADLPVAASGVSSSTELVRADDTRLTNSRTPSGSAGGDLTGTYPNPTIAALAVTDAKVAAANKDGAVGTPSMRTLGYGAQQALAGNTRLDQIADPTAPVNLNGQRITSVAAPTVGTDAANKDYVDGAVQGLAPKDSVRVATTANINLASPGTAIDGITLAAGDRVLVKNQTAGAENGVYVFNGSTSAMTRAADTDTAADLESAFVFVEEGTNHADSGWVMTTDNPTLGTTALTWVQFSGAGQINAGAGMTKVGNTLDVVGTANRIVANADSIDIASTYAGQTSITTLGTVATGTWNATTIALAKGGTGATTAAGARANLVAAGIYKSTSPALTAGTWSASINHGLNTDTPQVHVYDAATGEIEFVDVKVIDANNIQIRTDIARAAGYYRYSVQG